MLGLRNDLYGRAPLVGVHLIAALWGFLCRVSDGEIGVRCHGQG